MPVVVMCHFTHACKWHVGFGLCWSTHLVSESPWNQTAVRHLLSVLPATSSPGHTAPPCHHPADRDEAQVTPDCFCYDDIAMPTMCWFVSHLVLMKPHRVMRVLKIKPHLICPVTTPGHVTGFRGDFVSSSCAALAVVHYLLSGRSSDTWPPLKQGSLL